jgi:hypothetical protein
VRQLVHQDPGEWQSIALPLRRLPKEDGSARDIVEAKGVLELEGLFLGGHTADRRTGPRVAPVSLGLDGIHPAVNDASLTVRCRPRKR